MTGALNGVLDKIRVRSQRFLNGFFTTVRKRSLKLFQNRRIKIDAPAEQRAGEVF